MISDLSLLLGLQVRRLLIMDFVFEPELVTTVLDVSFWPEFVDVEGEKDGVLIIHDFVFGYFLSAFRHLKMVDAKSIPVSRAYTDDGFFPGFQIKYWLVTRLS
jgi:hypothetical protein